MKTWFSILAPRSPKGAGERTFMCRTNSLIPGILESLASMASELKVGKVEVGNDFWSESIDPANLGEGKMDE